MAKQTLPCAEKNCKSKMTLVEKNENLLGYNCLEKPNEHNFRYNITQKKWEKKIIKTKLILHYNQNPCEESLIETSSAIYEIEKILIETVQKPENISDLTGIKGIGSKRAVELELSGVKTVSDLAKRSPKHLSEKTGIPIAQISNWIIQANKLTKRTITISS